MGQEQDPPFPFFRRRRAPDGGASLRIPRKPHRQDTKSELKNHPPFVRFPSLPGIRGRPHDDFGSAVPVRRPRTYRPHRPGP